MSFVIDEPQPPRRIYGVPVRIVRVNDDGTRVPLIAHAITFGGGAVMLYEGEYLEAEIIGGEGASRLG